MPSRCKRKSKKADRQIGFFLLCDCSLPSITARPGGLPCSTWNCDPLRKPNDWRTPGKAHLRAFRVTPPLRAAALDLAFRIKRIRQTAGDSSRFVAIELGHRCSLRSLTVPLGLYTASYARSDSAPCANPSAVRRQSVFSVTGLEQILLVVTAARSKNASTNRNQLPKP
jgi:hypothetical protein